MREIRAELKDVYHVHAMENEYRKSVGMPLLGENDYSRWMIILFDESQHYILFKHGKKFVGMLWGHEDKWGSFVLEGKYLRPGFRSWRFKKYMLGSWLSIKQRFGIINMRTSSEKTRHSVIFKEVLVQRGA
jgi:hypothetical protein